MDDRLHVSFVSMCTHVCVQPAQRSLGWSVLLIKKSVKKRSIVHWTVQTMFSDLEVRLSLNSETKHSSSNCPNHIGELIVRPVKNRLNNEGRWGTTNNFVMSFLHFSLCSIFPCAPLPSGTWWTPGLSIPWCCLPTSSSVRLVFFPLSLCLAR